MEHFNKQATLGSLLRDKVDKMQQQERITSLELAKSSLSKARVAAYLTNAWELTAEELVMLSVYTYFSRKWETSWVLDSINDGCLQYDSEIYCVIYRGCSPATLRRYYECKLSFRASANGNYVIIQPALYSGKE